MELQSKVAIVTGGIKGIGKSISLDLAKKGVKVCATYHGDDDAAKLFESEISKYNQDYLIIKSDCSDLNAVENLFQRVNKELGTVDILINNAGIFISKDKQPDQVFRYKKVFETNFFSAVYTTEMFSKQLGEGMGKIINISSIAGINPFSYTGGIRSPEYDCSKASLDLYTKIMAKTFDGKILVNGVAPGSTQTPMWDGVDKDFYEIRKNETLINRFVNPEEISQTVIFLLKNDAINGEIIVVDGGNILN